ncbi:MAG: GC-type dockerin domain-anchored protein [Phycisphaerales bacterium]
MWRSAVVAGVVMLSGSAARAQERVVAALSWAHGQTSGPSGTNYEPPNDARDLWILEDFSITTEAVLTRFESFGTIFPAPQFMYDMTVRIYDAMPPAGNLVLASIPGTGRIVSVGLENRLMVDFQRQVLPAGSYWVAWNVSTRTNAPFQQIAIFWAQAGAHTVGGGQPDNAFLWNPNGGWGYPNNLNAVPAQLGGGGMIGVQFELFGSSCYANCDGSTAAPTLNIADFICFQNQFAAAHPSANCDASTTPPTLNVADFICFLNHFGAGCT